MSRAALFTLLAALSFGCSLSLDWGLPQSPSSDAGKGTDSGVLDGSDVGADAPEVASIDLGIDAPDDDAPDAGSDATADDDHIDADAVADALDAADANTTDAPKCVCSDAEVCIDGVCLRACSAGQSRCGAACFDLGQSTSHCGLCGVACRQGWRCCAGVCMMRCN